MEWFATYRAVLAYMCLAVAAGSMLALFIAKVLAPAWKELRKIASLGLIERCLVAFFVCALSYYGSSKYIAPSVRWDDGLRDNGTLITNDTVAVRWTYSGIPGASSVFIDYRETGTTNDWLNLAETLASAQEWTGTLANATNYDYWVYSTYVPPVPVHTNGVWVGQAYETKAKVGAKSFLILNGMVQEHGRTIATPAAKRRDLPYDSEVEYLKSDGAQYINTGIGKPGIGTITYWEAEAGFDSSYSATRKFAAGYEYPNMMYYCEFNNSQFGGVGWNARYFCNATLETRKLYKVSMSLNGRKATYSVVVGDDTITETASPASQQDVAIDGKFMLFCMSRQYNGSGVMIGKNKLWINGVLVGDYIPVRKNGVGYMYDCISHKLLGNAGTGSFGYGNDK